MSDSEQQFLRGVNLFVKNEQIGRALAQADSDQPDLRIRFKTDQQDAESPDHASIRVYNLSDDTIREIRKEYDSVVLQAGYRNGSIGTIFQGTIRQFRIGRESNVDSYLDLLVSDGDVGYNFGFMSSTLTAGQNLGDAVSAAGKAMGIPIDEANLPNLTGAQFLRGKVQFGMARSMMRDAARSVDATWSILAGKIEMIPLTGYLPGEAVELNSLTGVIGVPELTDQGVHVRTLLNPKLRVGGLVRINQGDIITLFQRTGSDPTRFDSFKAVGGAGLGTGFGLPILAADGLYRVYVVEHSGDTRGHEWYSDLICLAVNSNQVDPYGG